MKAEKDLNSGRRLTSQGLCYLERIALQIKLTATEVVVSIAVHCSGGCNKVQIWTKDENTPLCE